MYFGDVAAYGAKSFGFDFEGDLYLGIGVPLKLHDNRIQDPVECLNRSHHVDFD